jgi:hypothetical protein
LLKKKRTVQEKGSFFFWAMESKSSVPKVVIGLLAFTLFNSSDVFLLKAKESGLSDTLVIGIYIFTISFMLYLLSYRDIGR